MIAFNHVVPVLNLSVFNVRRAPAFAFEQSKRATIGGRFIRVDESRDLPLLHVVEDFTQKPVCSFAVTTGGEIKIDSAAPAVDGPVQIRPAAIDLHVGFIHVPRAKIGRVTPVPAQPFFHFRRITLNPAVNRGVIDIHSAFSQHLLQLTVTDAVFAVPAYGPQNDVTLKMPAFEWVHVQLHQQKGMISLSPPTICNSAIKSLGHQLDSRYRQVAARLCENEAVELDVSGPKPRLTISPLASLDEPDSLKRLSKMISDLLPPVDLTELLLEINAHTGFADEFFHASEASARVDDLPVSISAVLMAEACNIGLEPLIRSNVPALTRHRLNWTKANYLRAETITSANARLVDFQATLPLAQIWGGGEVASADGMRFVTPVRTINAGPNRKYFGNNRGITWYNFVSDQYSGFHGIVIPGTLRDSIFVLEGLLEQETGLNPTEIMTDTAGASELVFGLFWLLGYQFSPRLADAGASVFWRMDHDADYGVLNDIARGQSDPRKIVLQWDEMIRTAGSLKLGKVQVSVLVRSLLKSERPSGLTQAIIEVGRINKTLYLLNYIDDEDYRRRILTQLNRGESRHAVARAICHGQKGEIRKRYTDGQEDQLGTLGLVTNAVVLWNTIYMQAALDHLRAQGETLNDEDIARLSPLCHGHINMLGHYSFTLAELVTKGHLRPLKEASEAENVA